MLNHDLEEIQTGSFSITRDSFLVAFTSCKDETTLGKLMHKITRSHNIDNTVFINARRK